MENDDIKVQHVAERNLVLECNRDTDVYMGYVGHPASTLCSRRADSACESNSLVKNNTMPDLYILNEINSLL